MSVVSPPPARAQDPVKPGQVFIDGSVVVWSAHGAAEDPPFQYHPQFHGSLGWPAVGFRLGAGVFTARAWSLGAEFAARPAEAATITEETRFRFERYLLSSRYTHRDRLISLVGRRHLTRASIEVQPLAGVSISSSTRSLSDRHGVYEYFGGTVPIEAPDVSARVTTVGFIGGADVAFRARRALSLVAGARLHWFRQTEDRSRVPVLPPADPFAVHLGAGVTWRPRSR